MLPGGLIDTGAIVALLDASESRHQMCLEALARHLPLLTTEAVLTELFYFVQERSLGFDAAWRFVRSGQFNSNP
jgi:predicted nucleic acid-binding protein